MYFDTFYAISVNILKPKTLYWRRVYWLASSGISFSCNCQAQLLNLLALVFPNGLFTYSQNMVVKFRYDSVLKFVWLQRSFLMSWFSDKWFTHSLMFEWFLILQLGFTNLENHNYKFLVQHKHKLTVPLPNIEFSRTV